jgi:hypothetical protein
MSNDNNNDGNDNRNTVLISYIFLKKINSGKLRVTKNVIGEGVTYADARKKVPEISSGLRRSEK